MARGKIVEPPDWFQPEVYEAAKDFDGHKWLEALRARSTARFVYEQLVQQVQESPIISWYLEPKHYWKDFLDDAFPWMQEGSDTPPSYDDPSSYWHVPLSVQEVREVTADLPMGERDKLLLIDLNAPDTTIIEGVKRWLVQSRIEFPLPFKRRGRKVANLEITAVHFDRWFRFNILGVHDLDFYAKVTGNDKLTLEKLCQVANPGCQVDHIACGKEARKVVEEALACIDALGHQTERDGAK